MSVDIFKESRILRLGRWLYDLRVLGEENIPHQGGCVIAYNHAGRYLDFMTTLTIKAYRPDMLGFGAVGMPQSGWLARILKRRLEKKKGSEPTTLGAVKARGFSGVELLKAYQYLKDGRAIVIAAEGEVPWDGELLHPLAPGSAWMALRAQVPVLPVVSIGGYEILPRWQDYPKLSGRITLRIGSVFRVGDPDSTRVDEQAISEASQVIYDKMAALIALGHPKPEGEGPI